PWLGSRSWLRTQTSKHSFWQWTAEEQEMVAAKFGAAIFGGPERVAARLNALLEETQADELVVVTNTYKFEDRVRSYELLSNLAKQAREEPEIARTVEAWSVEQMETESPEPHSHPTLNSPCRQSGQKLPQKPSFRARKLWVRGEPKVSSHRRDFQSATSGVTGPGMSTVIHHDCEFATSMHNKIRVLRVLRHILAHSRTNDVHLEVVLSGPF